MDFEQYQQCFVNILNSNDPPAPYDQPDYLNYVKLNWSRQQRWLKTGVLDPLLMVAIQSISHEQVWTVITEPWCGDAAHLLPFIHRLTAANPHIKLDYQLRDSEPYLIDRYLTNGKKSIPKLIITKGDKELAVWGPRPAGCQDLFDQLLKEHADPEVKKIALQMWYNEDKGVSFQQELLAVVNSFSA